ncbi:MAG: tetratricopeptide repeat protein [Proteobacteria bacterium]|nr:tetratricopeptide repeat protein [Pseudomonadota bacterium]
MRKFNLLVIGFLILPCLSLADQTDSRLESLFTLLRNTGDLGVLRATEAQIWELWLQHPNTDVEQLMQLGTERMNLRRYSESLLIFNRIIENYPDYAEAWNKRATLYYLVGDNDASIADIEKTLALEPRHFGALSGLGLVYIQRNELSKAKQAFENLIEVHPNSPNARQNLRSLIERLKLEII